MKTFIRKYIEQYCYRIVTNLKTYVRIINAQKIQYKKQRKYQRQIVHKINKYTLQIIYTRKITNL